LLLCVLFLFPQRVYCAETITISFIEFDEEGNNSFSQKEAPPGLHNHLFAQVNTALEALFSLDLTNIYPYPEGVKITGLHYLRGHLSVALSDEIAAFGGGSMLERIYLGQILKTLLHLEGVEVVSIIANTPEGIRVQNSSCWYELMYAIVP